MVAVVVVVLVVVLGVVAVVLPVDLVRAGVTAGPVDRGLRPVVVLVLEVEVVVVVAAVEVLVTVVVAAVTVVVVVVFSVVVAAVVALVLAAPPERQLPVKGARGGGAGASGNFSSETNRLSQPSLRVLVWDSASTRLLFSLSNFSLFLFACCSFSSANLRFLSNLGSLRGGVTSSTSLAKGESSRGESPCMISVSSVK